MIDQELYFYVAKDLYEIPLGSLPVETQMQV